VASAPEWERRGLSSRGRRVAHALAEAILCDDGRGKLEAPAAMCARSVESFDRTVGACSGQMRAVMRLFLWLVEWLPPIVLRRASRASRMPLAERVRYLEALETSPSPLLATLFVAVKLPLTLSAYEEGAALAATGFDRVTIASRRVRHGLGGPLTPTATGTARAAAPPP
jgi:hypothetical protein